MASTPRPRSFGMREFTVVTSSLKVRPVTPLGDTIVGVSFKVMPMKPTRTPPNVLMTYGGKRVLPVASTVTFAEEYLNLAPSNGTGVPTEAPLHEFVSVGWQPPF